MLSNWDGPLLDRSLGRDNPQPVQNTRFATMPSPKRSIQSAVTIDGTPLIWHLHREQQGSDEDDMKGLAIHVKVAEGTRRELHLEYPAVRSAKAGYLWTAPARPTIVATKVAAHIREAMAEGWDPASRGKPYVYRVSEFPN